ncbi:MAG: putative TPR repeat methyltransferase [Parasphingorhabdus sp.]|jgi:predicted TPR repeat methyltransferase
MTNSKINTDQFDDRLAAVYNRTDDKEQQYDEWAKNYDHDLVNDMEYVAFQAAGDIFMTTVTDTSLGVLDVACGKGLAGAYLTDHCYQNIDGVDFSVEMLVRAKDRKIYQSTLQHDFTKPADIENLYDALICVGMFSFTIPKIADMHHVVNCVKPGGYCVITVNGAA